MLDAIRDEAAHRETLDHIRTTAEAWAALQAQMADDERPRYAAIADLHPADREAIRRALEAQLAQLRRECDTANTLPCPTCGTRFEVR